VRTPWNAFYDRVERHLAEHKFDQRVEHLCREFYKQSRYGRPSIAPGVYFLALLIGYFEGLDSERRGWPKKAKHAVDLSSGAVLAVTLQAANEGTRRRSGRR